MLPEVQNISYGKPILRHSQIPPENCTVDLFTAYDGDKKLFCADMKNGKTPLCIDYNNSNPKEAIDELVKIFSDINPQCENPAGKLLDNDAAKYVNKALNQEF